MLRSCTVVRGLVIMALSCAGAAQAEEAVPLADSPDGWNAHLDFDLGRDCRGESKSLAVSSPMPEHANQNPASWETEGLGKELKRLRPRWSRKVREDGPVIEFGTLGAGRDHTPKLAHIALGWDF